MQKLKFLILPGLFFPIGASAMEPAAIPVGDAELTPQVSLEYFSDDNVFALAENEIESPGLIVQPDVVFRASRGLNGFSLGYKGYYKQYSDADNLNYNDHNLYADAKLEFSSRSKLNISGSLQQKNEQPGYGLMDDIDETIDEPIRYNSNNLGVLYHYGADTATGGLEFGLDLENRDYQNQPEETDGYSYSSIKPSFTFLYRVSPDTRLQAGLEYQNFNYDEGTIASLDRTGYSAFIGSRWRITGLSGGDLKLGYGSRNFKSNDREDDTSGLISLGAYWLPLSYSRVEIDLTRSLVVETRTPSVKDRIAVNWRHQWSSRVTSFVNASYDDLDSDDDTDDQTTKTAKLGFDVNITRWSALTFAASSTDRDAKDDDRTFKRQLYTIGFKLSL